MGFGGGGIVLSRGLLRRTTTTIRSSTGSADEYGDLERCFDHIEDRTGTVKDVMREGPISTPC